MKLENKVLHINPSMDQEQLQLLIDELKKHIEGIDEVVIEEGSIATSGLFSLLASLKKTKSDIKISYFDNKNKNFAGIGNITFVVQG